MNEKETEEEWSSLFCLLCTLYWKTRL